MKRIALVLLLLGTGCARQDYVGDGHPDIAAHIQLALSGPRDLDWYVVFTELGKGDCDVEGVDVLGTRPPDPGRGETLPRGGWWIFERGRFGWDYHLEKYSSVQFWSGTWDDVDIVPEMWTFDINITCQTGRSTFLRHTFRAGPGLTVGTMRIAEYVETKVLINPPDFGEGPGVRERTRPPSRP
jgi:hypothetical protein